MKWLPLLLLLVGCGLTPQGDIFRAGVKSYGAQAYDEGLNNSVYFMCEVASHGSVERKFGGSADLSEAYNTICGRSGNSTLDRMMRSEIERLEPIQEP